MRDCSWSNPGWKTISVLPTPTPNVAISHLRMNSRGKSRIAVGWGKKDKANKLAFESRSGAEGYTRMADTRMAEKRSGTGARKPAGRSVSVVATIWIQKSSEQKKTHQKYQALVAIH
mmetsp:Transcript_14046/g.29020  ORF Transcript_14046/g.29020 Transcript_14046/m.29020 type:complete len:117 (+) Transcript_14046:1396-1746(+)